MGEVTAPQVEQLNTCFIVRMPEPKNYKHRQIFSALAAVCLNDPSLCDDRTFVLPYTSERLDLDALFNTINEEFGEFIYVEKVV